MLCEFKDVKGDQVAFCHGLYGCWRKGSLEAEANRDVSQRFHQGNHHKLNPGGKDRNDGKGDTGPNWTQATEEACENIGRTLKPKR